jgi:hypothetical protein
MSRIPSIGGGSSNPWVMAGGRRWGVEIKYADAPGPTKSMHIALADLKLERIWVVHPGQAGYRLAPRIEAIALADLPGAFAAAGIGRTHR